MSKTGWAVAAAAALGVAATAYVARGVRQQMGAAPSGGRAERVLRSPQFADGKFRNTVPATMFSPGSAPKLFRDFFFGRQRKRPTLPIPVVATDHTAAPAEGLAIVWYGHSSALIEIEGRRVLFDPIWSERCSPSQLAGPRRLHPAPVPLAEVPAVDAIVISHDHYDHLDMPTIRALARMQDAPFLVPLGVGAHLDRWGIPADRIVELDWDEQYELAGGVRLVATAARHFSGRGFSRDGTLWASWVLAGQRRRVFYTGDSGYFPGYAEIGAEHGPFDATLMQIGAYGVGWPDIHMTPEEGVAAHLDLRGDLLIPLHWATFNLAMHDWSEPADRIWQEAKAQDVKLAVPRPGERVDVDAPPAVDGWWQTIA